MVFVRFTPTVAEVEAFRRARPARARGLSPRGIVFWGSLVCVLAFTAVNQCWIFGKCPGPPAVRMWSATQMPSDTDQTSEIARMTFIHTLSYLAFAVLVLFGLTLLPRGIGRPPHPALYRTQQATLTESGFLLEDGFSRWEGAWPTLYGYSDTPSLLLLYRGPNDVHFIPKRAFDHPAALAWLMWVLATRARRV